MPGGDPPSRAGREGPRTRRLADRDQGGRDRAARADRDGTRRESRETPAEHRHSHGANPAIATASGDTIIASPSGATVDLAALDPRGVQPSKLSKERPASRFVDLGELVEADDVGADADLRVEAAELHRRGLVPGLLHEIEEDGETRAAEVLDVFHVDEQLPGPVLTRHEEAPPEFLRLREAAPW